MIFENPKKFTCLTSIIWYGTDMTICTIHLGKDRKEKKNRATGEGNYSVSTETREVSETR
jgi:hypothetical protein